MTPEFVSVAGDVLKAIHKRVGEHRILELLERTNRILNLQLLNYY